MWEKGNRSVAKVHRLVATLFVDGKKDDYEVNHKDYNRENNNFENLEWVSHADNIRYSINRRDMSGENNPNSKLNKNDVVEIKDMIKKGISVSYISNLYGVGWQTINHIKNGNTWNNI